MLHVRDGSRGTRACATKPKPCGCSPGAAAVSRCPAPSACLAPAAAPRARALWVLTALLCACRRCGCRPGSGRRLGAGAGEGLASSAPANRGPAALRQAPQEREQPAQGEEGAAPRPAARGPPGGGNRVLLCQAPGCRHRAPSCTGWFPGGRSSRRCVTEGRELCGEPSQDTRAPSPLLCWAGSTRCRCCVPAQPHCSSQGAG